MILKFNTVLEVVQVHAQNDMTLTLTLFQIYRKIGYMDIGV